MLMRFSPKIGIAALAGVTCLIMVVAALPAGAHGFSARTQAKIHDGGPDGAQGEVSSRNASCAANRMVRLFREQDGDDQLFGTDRTDRRGMWDVDAALIAGMYYVIVPRRHLRSDGHDHDCLRARSVRVQL
jgi:hypothetical protein